MLVVVHHFTKAQIILDAVDSTITAAGQQNNRSRGGGRANPRRRDGTVTVSPVSSSRSSDSDSNRN
jgi:hypothetical protein